MCRVRGVGFCAITIVVHASLSSYPIVAAYCGMSRSHITLRQYNIIHPKTAACMNSASVVDNATVGCRLDLYPTGPPANIKVPPPTDLRVIGYVAHSESMYPYIFRGPWCGRPSSRRLCALLFISGGGTLFRHTFGCARQKYIPSDLVCMRYFSACRSPT